MEICTIFAQTAEAPAPGAGPNPMIQLLIFGLIFVGMYFLMTSSQKKRQKKHEQMISNLTSGDEILTMGGVYGVITNIKDDRFVLRIADNTKIEINKAYIQNKVSAETTENPKKI